MKILTFFLSLVFLAPRVFSQTTGFDPLRYKVQKKVITDSGVVVSAHPLASRIGVMMMQKGGNAVDAIIATQLALAVVYPIAGNVGGGGFLIIRFSDGTTKVLDYRETAPTLASRNMYLNSKGELIKNLSTKGHLASGIPGTVAGLFASLKYAKLPFEELVQPAIELASKGFAITRREAKMLNKFSRNFINNNTKPCVFVKPSNKKWKEGDVLIQKDLANTLIRIKENGAKEFYEGKTADLIVQEMVRGKGLISKNDLKQYKVSEKSPLVFNYKKDYTIITMPPPSSGGVIMNQIFKMLEYTKLDDYSFQSKNYMNFIIEAERRAYADRNKYLADPDFVKIPLKQLTDSIYIKNRISDLVLGKAGSSNATIAGVPKESDETTHLTAVDKDRNVCVVTTTLNGNYGSFTVVGDAGFLLNNEMDDFTTKLGEANMYGSVGEEKNYIEPGKKMLSSMTPTIVLKNDKFYFSVGSPGGTTIPTSVLQTIVNIIDFKMSTEDAVNAPRFHHQWFPDSVLIEKSFSKQNKKELIKMNYKIKQAAAIGKVEVIRLHSDNKLEGIGDKRGDDTAEGY